MATKNRKPAQEEIEEIDDAEEEAEEAPAPRVRTRTVYRDRPREERPMASESAVAGIYERMGRIDAKLSRIPLLGADDDTAPPKREGKATGKKQRIDPADAAELAPKPKGLLDQLWDGLGLGDDDDGADE